MDVTDVRVRRVVSENTKVRALASVVIDECFVVHDFKIVEGTNGLFVSMPSRRNADGSFRDIAHPITAESREQLVQAVLGAYHGQELNEAGD